MKLSKIQLGILALIATNVIWGAGFPIYKWSLENIPPFTFVFFRFFMAAFLILPFTGPTLKIKREDFGTLIGLALSGVTLGVSFWFLGLQLTASVNAPVIGATGPILLLIFAGLFLHEKLKTKTIVGTVISLLGVLFIVIRPALEHGANLSILGNLFFLLATLSGLAQGICLKRIAYKYNLLALTFWSFIIGSFAILPMVLYESMTVGLLPNLDFQGIAGLLFGTIFSSAIAYSLFAYGIKQMKINEFGIFAYIDPIVASIIAVPLLGEKITVTYVIGAFLVFFGIYIAEAKNRFHPFHRLSKSN
jgi:drug/metabolite transporter (DMT)-like permease